MEEDNIDIKHKILIVEDVPVQAKKLQFVLLRLGYEVTWKEDGVSAIEELEKNSYDLIISDYQMPKMDGLELLKKVKEDELIKHTPFILLTTIEDDNIFFKSLKLGASEFINKPFRKEELELRCRNLISLYKYQILIEEELVNMKSQLVQSAKMASLGVMGAGVAHEINNPLTVINSYNDKLGSLIEKDEFNKSLAVKINKTISKSVDRIIKIVSHLKLFSGSENYSKDTDLQIINLTDVIEDLQDFYGGLFVKYDISVEKSYHQGPLEIRGYKTMLEQICLNLIHNAVDAMEHSSTKILTIKTYPDNNSCGVIEIGDSGEGISSEVYEKIFDPFFTTKDPGKGTGLGMSLVKTYVKELDGNIYCKSNPGSTVFTLKFELI